MTALYSRANGGRSSVGRAPACDAGGRGFKPHRPPHLIFDLIGFFIFKSCADTARTYSIVSARLRPFSVRVWFNKRRK